jgi:hypothetical protein
MRFWHEEQELTYKKLQRKPEPLSKSKRYYRVKGKTDPSVISKNSRRNKHRTPWSRFNSHWLKTA